ncbi:MAG: SUF system Fe-S cluster assembly regulator [Acidobacteria bacterium]|nr:MAG: SUF system Fe-S cluster assembly regulator [Acidobacteriota bacterium]
MLRITKQADYGIVLLTRMAADPERLFTASGLAAEAGLPHPIVSKVLKLLVRGGVLSSHRGVKGGYTLDRSAEEITVFDIVTVLEGPIAITECIDDSPSECSQEPHCPVRGNWQRINRAIQLALEDITLAEMTRASAPRLVTLGETPKTRDAELL